MTISQYTPQTSSHLYLRRFKVFGWYVTTWGPVIPVASSFGIYGLTGYQREFGVPKGRPQPGSTTMDATSRKNQPWGMRGLKSTQAKPKQISLYILRFAWWKNIRTQMVVQNSNLPRFLTAKKNTTPGVVWISFKDLPQKWQIKRFPT